VTGRCTAPCAFVGTNSGKCPEVFIPINFWGSRQYGQNLKSALTKHFFADGSMLSGYNPSLTATNEFEG
jgi:hypothetical protein